MSTDRVTDTLVVAYVTAGSPCHQFVDSICNLRTFDASYGPGRLHDPWRISVRSGANISRARNDAVRTFLDLPGRPTWLFMVDDDMVFDPTVPERLVRASASDRVVGALCFSVGAEGVRPTMFQRDEKGWVDRWAGPVPENQLVRVAATGAACLAIHRDVLERIGAEATSPQAWFREAELQNERQSQWVSEDVFFCLEAQRAGAGVFVHTGVEVGHVKPLVVTRELFDRQDGLRLVWG